MRVKRRKIQHGDCSSIGRVLDCESSGYGFEPRLSPKNAKGGTQKNLYNPLSVKKFFENFVAKNIYNLGQNT